MTEPDAPYERESANSETNSTNKWKPVGTRLAPTDYEAWKTLLAENGWQEAEIIRRFCRRFLRSAQVREDYS